jgi:hypothetical protein
MYFMLKYLVKNKGYFVKKKKEIKQHFLNFCAKTYYDNITAAIGCVSINHK